MNALTLFGLVAVSLMLVFYALEPRSAWYILGFALSCSMASLYGFLQGAWPFGVVEGVWALVALHRWRRRFPQSMKTSSRACSVAAHSK
jgi:hypothetical protein